jgi:hypothetical protein
MPYLVEKMPEIPALIYRSLKMYTDGEYHSTQINEIKKIREQLNNNHQRSLIVITGSSLLIAASVIYTLDENASLLFGAPLMSWIPDLTGAILIIYGLKK